ncbi:hypothetical protein KIH31_14815 [Paenarthrobacter sp. DKR-5]|uniref:hypothetical protein n=1 Tax=Paenarthrobacter sp. DKR-5 TaxID=2835535 RepID=UPI001BDC8EC6|nr:hypothetical protein [Paenarthrobacter sp. DKR-5]MBT1003869.1 hypothetical protein [Paenarthrobacter sp. DKR-5]
MRKTIIVISRATWWQVGFLIVLAIVSPLDLTPPRVVDGVGLLTVALVVVVCKRVARGPESGAAGGVSGGFGVIGKATKNDLNGGDFKP